MSRYIAIVEDEPAIAENYKALFVRQGYQVQTFAHRQSAWHAFQQRLPDLAIIDIGLAEDVEGGFELCRDLRALAPQLPIIFLTARDSEYDAVSGLRLGADDFLSKDISLPHLAARVVALFRRINALSQQDTPQLLNRGELSLDSTQMRATWQTQPLPLTLTEFWIIHALASHPGHVKSRQQLMQAANVVLDDNTITSHIKRIRRKFQQIDGDFQAIESIYGLGYRWLESSHATH